MINKRIVMSDGKYFNIKIKPLKDNDAIILSFNPDTFDISEASCILQEFAKTFPKNAVVLNMQGEFETEIKT